MYIYVSKCSVGNSKLDFHFLTLNFAVSTPIDRNMYVKHVRYRQKETPQLFTWEFSCYQLAHRESIACNWLLYKLLFSRGFYFREFREPDPRENFHFNSCLFIVMTTSEKSRNYPLANYRKSPKTRK